MAASPKKFGAVITQRQHALAERHPHQRQRIRAISSTASKSTVRSLYSTCLLLQAEDLAKAHAAKAQA